MSYESELRRVQTELGIEGDGTGYYDTVGATVGRPQIAVPAPGDKGDGVLWPLPATAPVALAAAAVGNLIFTPNRNFSIVDIVLDCYVAAAAAAAMMPAALKVTNITVQGRPQLAGIGEIPVSAFRPINPKRYQLVMENCQSGQNIVVSLINNDALTAHNVTGTIWGICVK